MPKPHLLHRCSAVVWLAVSCVLLIGTVSSRGLAQAAADAGKTQRRECAEAYEKGQELRASEQLLEAKQAFTICAQSECFELVNRDCLRWLDDLESRTPSFVIAVLRDGQPVSADKIQLNGQEVPADKLGKTQVANPGMYEVRAELVGFEPIVRQFRLLAGQRLVEVKIEFESPQASQAAATSTGPAQPSAPGDTPSAVAPVVTYALLGVAAAGGAAFGTFAFIGKNKQDALDGCKPDCRRVDVDERNRSYLIADISLGVGVAALIGAGVAYWWPTRKDQKAKASTPQLMLAATPRHGSVSLRSEF